VDLKKQLLVFWETWRARGDIEGKHILDNFPCNPRDDTNDCFLLLNDHKPQRQLFWNSNGKLKGPKRSEDVENSLVFDALAVTHVSYEESDEREW
jgi:hypothetical protein